MSPSGSLSLVTAQVVSGSCVPALHRCVQHLPQRDECFHYTVLGSVPHASLGLWNIMRLVFFIFQQLAKNECCPEEYPHIAGHTHFPYEGHDCIPVFSKVRVPLSHHLLASSQNLHPFRRVCLASLFFLNQSLFHRQASILQDGLSFLGQDHLSLLLWWS